MFEYEWKCAWGDADPHGIAYYPNLIDAMHRAGEEYMDEIGVAYWDIPDEYGVHLPIVSMDTDFKRPVETGDVLTITVDPDVGGKSLGLELTAHDEDGNELFSGDERHVCVSKADNRPQELPDELKDAIADSDE
ncbi:acyl-CoA thioesterase [Halobellus captivus]|uniref:acyl-CoA thioesterase n=1 Tax=Halobellus captivus TaxID=2592614 RepID=UPI00193AA7B3|nr:thioesterase family protein [Halobellus captivus]